MFIIIPSLYNLVSKFSLTVINKSSTFLQILIISLSNLVKPVCHQRRHHPDLFIFFILVNVLILWKLMAFSLIHDTQDFRLTIYIILQHNQPFWNFSTTVCSFLNDITHVCVTVSSGLKMSLFTYFSIIFGNYVFQSSKAVQSTDYDSPLIDLNEMLNLFRNFSRHLLEDLKSFIPWTPVICLAFSCIADWK